MVRDGQPGEAPCPSSTPMAVLQTAQKRGENLCAALLEPLGPALPPFT